MRTTLLALLAAVVLTSACGSSGPTTPATTAPATPKAAFQQRANAICRDMKTKGDALTASASSVTDPAALTGVFNQMTALVSDAVARLRALTPPPGDEATVKQAIDALAAAGDATAKMAATPSDDQTALGTAVEAQARAQKDSDLAMTAYGLNDCTFGS